MADEPPGDRSAFVGRLYEAYGDRMYRYALMLTADRSHAADVVHDVLQAVLTGEASIASPLAYLRRAVRNRAVSVARTRLAHAEVSLDEALLEPAPGSSVSPTDRLALERAIRALSVEQREVVHLHAFEGLTLQEVAEVTATSINTASARYRYALTHLRRALAPAADEGVHDR